MQPIQLIPQAPFNHLQALWFQLTGTLCNLECSHCFIACSPTNQQLKFLSPDTVYAYLEEAVQLGVREVYFTGGEPFLHKQIVSILTHALTVAPTTVLTNGTLITPAMADTLAALEAESRYTLEIRISLDDVDESNNDAVRGRGALAKALRALKLLYARGMTPIVAVTEYFYASEAPSEPSGMGSGFYQKFRDFLLANGINKPRLKIIPVFPIGKMEDSKPMASLVTPQMLHGFDFTTLQCTQSRMVADGGVYACPLLVGEPGARLSTGSLHEALKPCALYHTACHTCYVTGMTCANY
ncbi:MAG: radical SAM protein [bacterium]|nr:radical SAM protein [bacterium]